MPSTPELRRAQARIARLYCYGGTPDPEVAAAARRDYAAAKIDRAIRESIAAAPPLSDEQREHLVGLLRGPA